MTSNKLVAISISILFFFCSNQPINPLVLAYVNNKPLITGEQFKKEIEKRLHDNLINIKDVPKGAFYDINMRIFDILLCDYHVEKMDTATKQKLLGTALFLSCENVHTIADLLNRAKSNIQENKAHILTGFTLGVMNQKVIEIEDIKRWIEMYSPEITKRYETLKKLVIENKIKICIPQLNDVKNLIGFFMFLEITATADNHAKLLDFTKTWVAHYTARAVTTENKIEINYADWRKLYNELCIKYNLEENPEPKF